MINHVKGKKRSNAYFLKHIKENKIFVQINEMRSKRKK